MNRNCGMVGRVPVSVFFYVVSMPSVLSSFLILYIEIHKIYYVIVGYLFSLQNVSK